MKKLFKKLYDHLTSVKSYHTYETIPRHMEKYYKPIPKEELRKPLPGDQEIESLCLAGIIITGLLFFVIAMPW